MTKDRSKINSSFSFLVYGCQLKDEKELKFIKTKLFTTRNVFYRNHSDLTCKALLARSIRLLVVDGAQYESDANCRHAWQFIYHFFRPHTHCLVQFYYTGGGRGVGATPLGLRPD